MHTQRSNFLGLSLLVAVASCRDLAGYSTVTLLGSEGNLDAKAEEAVDGASPEDGESSGGDVGNDVSDRTDSGTAAGDASGPDSSRDVATVETGTDVRDSSADGNTGIKDGGADITLDADGDLPSDVSVDIDAARLEPSCPDASTIGGALCAEVLAGTFSPCSGGPANTSSAIVLATFDPDDSQAACPWPGQGAGPCDWASALPPGENLPYTGGLAVQGEDDFDACGAKPGCLQYNAEFVPYDQVTSGYVRVRVVYNRDRDLTGKSRLHMWIRVKTPAPSLSYLMVYTASSSAGGSSGALSDWRQLPFEPLSDGKWHEVIYTLTGLGYLTTINQIGVALYPAAKGADAGPTPAPVTIYVDNVWAE